MYLPHSILFFPFVFKVLEDDLLQLLYNIFIPGVVSGYGIDGLPYFLFVGFVFIL